MQIDTSELIGRLEQRVHQALPNADQMRDEVSRAVRTLPLREQSQRLDDAFRVVQQEQQSKSLTIERKYLKHFLDDQTIQRFSNAKQQQEQLERRIQNLLQQQFTEQAREQITTIRFDQNFQKLKRFLHFSQQEQQPIETKQTVHHETHIQSTSPPTSRPPRLVSPFNDAQVEEGQRFEFKVQVATKILIQNKFIKFLDFRLMACLNPKLNGQKMDVKFVETVTITLRF